jgi:hypothetical protein
VARGRRPPTDEERAWVAERVSAGAQSVEEMRRSGGWYPGISWGELLDWADDHGVPYSEPPS